MKSILIAVGGSGGHIIPALTLAEAWHAEGAQIFCIAQEGSLERALLEPCTFFAAAPFFVKLPAPHKGRWWHYPLHCYELFRAWWCVRRYLKSYTITEVVTMGGIVSIPVVFAAWSLRIPRVVYELNAELGRAVRLLVPCVTMVRCCFSEALPALPPAKRERVAYPVRTSLVAMRDAGITRDDACTFLGCTAGKKMFLVLGGSQGSQLLNELLLRWCGRLITDERLQIQMIHQTGAAHVERVQQAYRELGVAALVFAYRNDMEYCYRAASVVITRAGSGALHEIAHFQLPALIIPLKTGYTSHQVANAHAFAARDPLLWSYALQRDEKTIFAWLQQQVPKAQAAPDVQQHQEKQACHSTR